MTPKIKTSFLILFLFLIPFFSIVSCSKIAAGSYPYAELYELNYPQDQVLKAIESIKTKNPDLKVSENLTDTNSSDHWHHEWFTLGNNMIQTWTRSANKNKTTFALVGVGTIGNWRRVNYDLSSDEDDKIKNQFQESILDKVKEELKNINNSQ